MKAILVIDMLEDYFSKDPLKSMRPELTRQINKLTEKARSNQVPIIWVRQEFQEDLSDAFPVMKKEGIRITIAGTKGCEILPELVRKPEDRVIIKKRYSAFYGTGLEQTLKALGVREVIVTGVNTHACIRMAAIDAYQRDLEVTIPLECVASYDQEHHEITLKYLRQHMVRIIKTAELYP